VRREWCLVVGSLVITGCPAGFANVCDNGACDSDAAVDGGGDTGTDGPPICDPKTENCIDPAAGVFVSPAGNDGNDGTQANPLQTIGAGLTKAKANGKARVYVCAGTYAENVVINDPIALLGGFSCSDWSYASSNAATVAPASGYALEVASTTTSLNDLSFVAADASASGASSIAAFVNTSTVTLLRTTLTAGTAQPGVSATAGANYTAVNQNDPSRATMAVASSAAERTTVTFA
jgi:hypothetical protein